MKNKVLLMAFVLLLVAVSSTADCGDIAKINDKNDFSKLYSDSNIYGCPQFYTNQNFDISSAISQKQNIKWAYVSSDQIKKLESAAIDDATFNAIAMQNPLLVKSLSASQISQGGSAKFKTVSFRVSKCVPLSDCPEAAQAIAETAKKEFGVNIDLKQINPSGMITDETICNKVCFNVNNPVFKDTEIIALKNGGFTINKLTKPLDRDSLGALSDVMISGVGGSITIEPDAQNSEAYRLTAGNGVKIENSDGFVFKNLENTQITVGIGNNLNPANYDLIFTPGKASSVTMTDSLARKADAKFSLSNIGGSSIFFTPKKFENGQIIESPPVVISNGEVHTETVVVTTSVEPITPKVGDNKPKKNKKFSTKPDSQPIQNNEVPPKRESNL